MDDCERLTNNSTNEDDRDNQLNHDTEFPAEEQVQFMDGQSAVIDENVGMSSARSEQRLASGEADFTQENQGSFSEMSSVESKEQVQFMDGQSAVIDGDVGMSSARSEQRLASGEADFTQENQGSLSEMSSVESNDSYSDGTSTEGKGGSPNCTFEASESNVFIDQSLPKRVEQALENLKVVEKLQENGQYAEALSCCQSALQKLDFSQDANLYMRFCSNIMQLHYLMEDFFALLSTYDCCVDVLGSVSDPKVIQSIMDLYTLCMKKVESRASAASEGQL